MSSSQDFGFACTHLAIGSLVLVGLASSELSGAGSIVALPISGLSVTLSAWCNLSINKKSQKRKRSFGDALDFLAIWMTILEHLTAAATCARVASATIDYTSDGRLRDLLFGIQSHSLGEPWPDVLGVTIIVILTALFMLGLEKSKPFCILLYFGITASVVFFLLVGGYHTDVKFWNWEKDFKLRKWSTLLTTAAMSSYGFINIYPSRFSTTKKYKILLFLLLPLFVYVSLTLVFTLMSHYRELAGTAIPLVRVFEVRAVDWARPVMAACTISVVCLALTEIIPPLYHIFVHLASNDWQILVSPLLYRSSVTGAPILAIFTAGSLVSILAFACPLNYLIRLLNISTLMKCSLTSFAALLFTHKTEFEGEEVPSRRNIQYSRLDRKNAPRRKFRMSGVLNMLPQAMRRESIVSKGKRGQKRETPDREYLLLDGYTTNQAEEYQSPEPYSDSDTNDVLSPCSDGEDESSSTDIDAAVQEYRERVQVTTTTNLSTSKQPTTTTSRIVSILSLLIFFTSFILYESMERNLYYLVGLSVTLIAFSTLIILLMPQTCQNDVYSGFFSGNSLSFGLPFFSTSGLFGTPGTSVKLVPYLAVPSMVLNNVLAATLLLDIWLGLFLWTVAGLILFCRCNCCNDLPNISYHRGKFGKGFLLSEEEYKDYVDAIFVQR